MDSRFVDFGIMEQDEFKQIYATPHGTFCHRMWIDVQRAFCFKKIRWDIYKARNITKSELAEFVNRYFVYEGTISDKDLLHYFGMNPTEELKKILELLNKLDNDTECAICAWFFPG